MLLLVSGCAQPTDSAAPNAEPDLPVVALPVLEPCAGVVGPSLVFSGTHSAGSSVDVYGVTATGAVVPLTDDGKSSAPDFHPDGESLVFARAETREGSAGGPPPATALWTMDLDGGNQRNSSTYHLLSNLASPQMGLRSLLPESLMRRTESWVTGYMLSRPTAKLFDA